MRDGLRRAPRDRDRLDGDYPEGIQAISRGLERSDHPRRKIARQITDPEGRRSVMPCFHPFGVSTSGGAVFPVVFAPLDHRLMANGKNPFGIQTLIAGRSVRTGSQRLLSRKTRQGVLITVDAPMDGSDASTPAAIWHRPRLASFAARLHGAGRCLTGQRLFAANTSPTRWGMSCAAASGFRRDHFDRLSVGERSGTGQDDDVGL